jgi:hypothetical protein
MDEVQFLNDDLDRGWHSKIAAVKDAAAFVLVMSGTLWRTDNRVIPFVELRRRRVRRQALPALGHQLRLREAVAERAILPTEWRNRAGARYTYLGDGVTQTHELLDDGDDEESRKVRAFLSCEASVSRLLDDMVDDWRDWCKRTYQSRMIVMADDTREARRWRDHLQTAHNRSPASWPPPGRRPPAASCATSGSAGRGSASSRWRWPTSASTAPT